jgi:DNA-binding MarR family transcriptional regulator
MSREETDTTREPITNIDRIIHEPARMLICALLAGVDQADFIFLQRETELTKGNLSSHLSTLEKAGYVEIEKTYAGKRPLTLVKLTKTGHRAFGEYKRQISAFLGGNNE